MADGIALEGMRLIFDFLPRATSMGDDLEARANMLTAASMGATAFQKGLGGIHAIAHGLGALYNTHHGLANAIVMPYVLQANRPAIEDHMVLLGRYLGLPSPGYDAVLKSILELRETINIPHTLGDIGIDERDAVEIGERAVKDPTAGGNPVRHDAKTYEAIFRRTVSGDMS